MLIIANLVEKHEEHIFLNLKFYAANAAEQDVTLSETFRELKNTEV